MKKLCAFMESLNLPKYSCFPILLARLSLGWIFIESGWGKLHNLNHVIEFFTELGIPAPHLQAPFVAGVELVGGICLALGALNHLVPFLLSSTMVVAIATAKWSDVHSASDLFGLEEYLIIILLVWIFFSGPGSFSVAAFCKRKCAKNTPAV